MAGGVRFRGGARRVPVAVLVPLLSGLAACGGGSEPTAEERREAKSRWVQRVDASCRKANDAIAGRGWPTDLVDLDRLVVRGIADARAAIRSIAGLALPEGSGPRPGAFVRELKALDPELTKLSEASEELAPPDLVKAAEALKPQLVAVEKSAEAAGLGDCLTHDERFFVPDAVRAPAFAEQFNRLNRRVLRRIRRIDLPAASTFGEVATAFERLSAAVESAIDGVNRLDPPQWAAGQTSNYLVALRELQSSFQEYDTLLERDRGKPPEERDRPRYLRQEKELRRAGRAEGNAHRKLLRAVGARPTGLPEGGGGDSVLPEDEEQS